MKRLLARAGLGVLMAGTIVWLGARLAPIWRARLVTPVMGAYMQAVATGDSAAVARLVAADEPERWAGQVHRAAPALADEARHGVRARLVARHGDTLLVVFALRHAFVDTSCGMRSLQDIHAGFIQRSGKWRVAMVAVDPC